MREGWSHTGTVPMRENWKEQRKGERLSTRLAV